MKRILYITFVVLTAILSAGINSAAQSSKEILVSGTVKDPKGEPLVGVAIAIKNEPGVGVVTDVEGKYKISVKQYSTLSFTYLGFKKIELPIVNQSKLDIVMEEDQNYIDDVVVVGYGVQRKATAVGAVSTIKADELEAPSNSISNMLGGKVPGIIAVSRTGEPGKDNSEFWIRGISTFGANSSALVLIDGVEGDLNSIDPSDILSFSVLKDASATAVFGIRGANGVVIVTTKKGSEGKLHVNFKSSASLSYSPRMPEYVDAYTYGKLANEARAVRDLPELYDDVELTIFRENLDRDLYPNVNWQDEVLRKTTWNHQEYLSMSGGGNIASYFISGGMQTKSAIFNSDNINKYNTDQKWRMYTWRANVTVNATKTTKVGLNIDGSFQKFNYPGYGNNSDAVWGAIANLSPATVPVMFSNGKAPGYGTEGDQISPYVVLNETGFRTEESNNAKMSINISQDLKFVTPGLWFSMLYSLSTSASKHENRYKMPALYRAIGRNANGELLLEQTKEEQLMGYGSSSNHSRYQYFEARLNYDRDFNGHRVGALINYYCDESVGTGHWDNMAAIPYRRMSVASRVTYSYKDTYLLEVNGGLTGSENFKTGEQFGFFPSVGLGWVPTQYDFMKENLPWLNYFKIRASYGHVGNDQISGRRFPYFTYVSTVGGKWGSGALGETQVGVDNIHWEVAKKFDLGLDMKFFRDRLELTVDYFNDMRDGIYQERYTMPSEVGSVQYPFSNIGSVSNKGFDGVIAYYQPLGEFYLTVRGNLTYARSDVKNWEQTAPRYEYQNNNGKPLYVQRGLIALGLFKDEKDIMCSPKQTYGEVLPGDIKYKDVNGDGVIDDDDIVPLSYSPYPRFVYGLAAELTWRDWTLSMWFKGASKCEYFLGGTGYYPFSNGQSGNVLTMVADQSQRWTPASYSGDPATENPNARFPRMTYGYNTNNNRASTFWLADGSYLKLQNVSIRYRWNSRFFSKLGISYCDLSLIGENLACWDRVKLWDPEQASSNGAVYPLQRRFSFQLNLTF